MFLTALLLLSTIAAADQNWQPTSMGVTNQSTFTCTNTSTKVMNANSARAYLLVENTGATNAATITFGAAQVASEGVVLAPGGVYGALYEPKPAPVNSIYCKSASGTTISLIEGAK
jgi:hypothetical protein